MTTQDIDITRVIGAAREVVRKWKAETSRGRLRLAANFHSDPRAFRTAR